MSRAWDKEKSESLTAEESNINLFQDRALQYGFLTGTLSNLLFPAICFRIFASLIIQNNVFLASLTFSSLIQ